MFCCLLLSAMKLQASTHCLISGAAWAKLLYKLAVLVTSILSTRWHRDNHKQTKKTRHSEEQPRTRKEIATKVSYRWIASDRASPSVCQTSFHCEVVSGHIPLLSASDRRSCGAAPLCHSPPLWPHSRPPAGACTGSEGPFLGTPEESIES